MRVSVCVGDYAKKPYCVPGLEVNVFCLEELCCCLKENAFLLDLSLLNDNLLEWIGKECGLAEFARELHPYVHKQGSLSSFVSAILKYVGFYGAGVIRETEQLLKQGSGLTGMERRKSQIDYLVKKKRYKPALKGYEELLQGWEALSARETGQQPAAGFLASVWHNKGVAYVGMMRYGAAAECFRQAIDLGGDDDCCLEYLEARRRELAQEDYVALVAEQGELYRHSLELEKKMEQASQEWEQHPDYLRLCSRRELGEKVEEEDQRLVQALKESYRRF